MLYALGVLHRIDGLERLLPSFHFYHRLDGYKNIKLQIKQHHKLLFLF